MYTLYSSYGVDVGTLFLTGFLSSAVFGTFLGIYVDSWGRKFGCVVFCVLEVIINILEHIPSMPCLLVGRVLGGLSTSLLFTAFESWMVAEHRKRGFPESLLASTFSISSWGNGFVAIIAGFVAQYATGDLILPLSACPLIPLRVRRSVWRYRTISIGHPADCDIAGYDLILGRKLWAQGAGNFYRHAEFRFLPRGGTATSEGAPSHPPAWSQSVLL